ncbi:MAG TPA: hypothetical protein VHA80_07545 [Solirubrobacterales bacterium]|nr:hypothetical protein [Solirubrobacterales bacterium]
MSATVPLTHFVPDDGPRDGYLTRLRVRALRGGLDRRLAAGADPLAEPDLTRRAAQLTEPGTRRRIAAVLDGILDEAVGSPAPFSSRVPLARTAIVACAPRICEIAGRLEGEAPVAAQGVAQATILVHDGDSPLFSTSTSDTALNHHLAGIVEALG